MDVLVTGGLGFLGHAVTLDLMAAGHRVTVLTRGRASLTLPAGVAVAVGDLRDRDRMRALIDGGRFDGVVHLAALTQGRASLTDPLTYYDVNVGGTLNLLMALDAVQDHHPASRLVFASTNIVYGSTRIGALDEGLEPHPESPYAASKVAAEQLVAAHAATGAIGAITIRPFNIAGAVNGVTDTDPARIIPNALRVTTGQLPHITMNGDGSAIRDFVHVADVASIIRLALDTATPGNHRVYNAGSGLGTSMAKVIQTIETITGRPIPVVKTPPKPEPQVLTANIDRATSELDWNPQHSDLHRILTDAWNAWPKS